MTMLGRKIPTDWGHIDKYPLRAAPTAVVADRVPVVLGINWYSNFDSPVKDGRRYWIGRGGSLGNVRGGHAVCLKPWGVRDYTSWQEFYDQGHEGACVGFSSSRMMTLLNRQRYAAQWLYKEAQKVDEWSGEDYDGTSVRAACDVLRDRGHRYVRGTSEYQEQVDNGISANRWATDWQEVRDALGVPDYISGVPLLNSWGFDYPHITYLADEAGSRVLSEYGEATLVTDR